MYQTTALNYLRGNKPNLDEDPKHAAKVAAGMVMEREAGIIAQMTKGKTLDSLESLQEMNRAQMTAREIATAEMIEFLSSL